MPTQKTTFSPPQKVSSQLTAYWSQPSFTFSAKERDVETRLRVTSLRSVSSLRLGKVRTSSLCTRSLRRFGSRYYSSDLSIWLSVDPQAAKYPSLSPFTYCADNPIKLVDPNGEEIGDFFDYSGKYLGTDGIDDGKIYITTQEDWNNCSQLESGMTLLTTPQLGFSKEPSKVDLSDEAILNIYQHYNNTSYSLKAMNRGIGNRQDNGISAGMMSDHMEKTIFVRIDGNKNSKITDNYFEITNIFVHERQHIDDYKKGVNVSNASSERNAITSQMNDLSFPKTRLKFQEATKEYGRQNGMKFH